MPTRWFILIAGAVLLCGGVVLPLRNPGTCDPLETSNDCTTAEAYSSLWAGDAAPKTTDTFFDAVLHDPASPLGWSDLADALLLSGDRTRAIECSRRSIALGPQIPSVLLRALNFGVLAASQDDAAAAAAELLAIVPDQYGDVVFAQLARGGLGPSEMESKLLARNTSLARPYLWRLMQANDAASAASVMEWMRAHNLATSEVEREYRAFAAEHRTPGP